jgi:hypothetical protein
MNAKSVEADPKAERWWSIPQTIIWIFSRNRTSVERATNLTTIASVKQLDWLLPFKSGDSPPLSLGAAQTELLREAVAEKISIFGEKWHGYVAGGMELVPVHALPNPNLIDFNGLHESTPCIIEARQLEPGRRAWTARWVGIDECMRLWPSPAPPVNSTEVAVQSAPSIITPAPYSPSKRGVAEKDDSDLLAKVRCAMADNPGLAIYAAVQRHCGEKTKNGVEAAYKRVKRKINLEK